MAFAKRGAGLAFVLLAAAGCNVSIGGFQVPSQVWAGRVFEVVVSGSGWGGSGPANAILQLPIGFGVEQVTGYWGNGWLEPLGQVSPTNSVPSMTPEPGHYLVAYGGFWPSTYQGGIGGLKIHVRAPSVVGNHVLKVVGASSTAVTSPAGATDFATVTAAPNAAPITIVPDPVTPFVPDVIALGLLPAALGVACADVDGDGLDDFASVGHGSAGSATRLSLPRGGGAWQIALPVGPRLGGTPRDVAFGDFDGDGFLDLVDSSGMLQFGSGGATWVAGPALPLLVPEWFGVTAGDVDGDGNDDVAFAAANTDAIMVFRSNGDRTFVDWSGALPSGTNGPAGSDRLRLCDVTGDGIVDIVATGLIGTRVWAGDGAGGWVSISAGLPAGSGFDIGDWDRDGRSDLVIAAGTGVEVYSYLTGSWVRRPLVVSGTSTARARALVLLDADRDGWLDVALGEHLTTAASSSSLGIDLRLSQAGTALGAPQPLVTRSLGFGLGCTDLAVGDFDGDAWPDLVVAIEGERPIVLWNTGSGLSSFGSACAAPTSLAPSLGALGAPTLGNQSFALTLNAAVPASPALLWIGFSRHTAYGQTLPLALDPIGAPGCAFLVSVEAQHFLLTDAGGHAQVGLPIPPAPALKRLLLFAQAAVYQPAANPLGMLFTGGLALRVP
jgi:hypothetical protein